MTLQLVVRRRILLQEFSRNRQAFAKNQISWRCSNVRLDRRPYGKHCARESPEPSMRFLGAECDKRLFESPVKPFNHSVSFRVIRGREDGLDAPDFC